MTLTLVTGSLAACSGADTATNTGSTSDSAANITSTSASATNVTSTIRKQVQAGVSTELLLPATPEASCTLHAAPGAASVGSGVKLFADGTGHVRFQTKAATDSQGVLKMLLDCATSNGATTTTAVELESVNGPVAETAASDEVEHLAALSKLYSTRPALAESDFSLPTAELVARGYSPSPDRNKAPAAFEAWKANVTKPMVRIPSVHHLDTGETHAQKPPPGSILSTKKVVGGGASSPRTTQAAGVDTGAANGAAGPDINDTDNSWCGVVLLDTPAYSYVAGAWQVPSVSGPIGLSSTWIGLDGFNVHDLLQAGTRQDTTIVQGGCGGGICVGSFEFSVYYAWYEWFPANEQRTMDVGAGDSITAYVYAGDANGTISATGTYMWFLIEDTTRGTMQQGSLARPSNSPSFAAYSAEWITERPSLGSNAQPLADFVSTRFTSTFAFDPNDFSFHDYVTDYSDAITMVSNTTGNLLALPYFDDESDLGAYYVNTQ